MSILRKIVPRFLREYIWLIRLRRAHPGRIIDTHKIAHNARIGVKCAFAEGVVLGANVSVGDYSYINTGTIVQSGQIGKFCSIASYCQIGMPEHPIDYISTSPFTYSAGNIFGVSCDWKDIKSPPKIANDVWIGSHVVVLQGVKISDGVIVAAGSVVTKDVPPYAIVGGVPAKLIRYRFPAEVISRLLTWRWWSLTEQELQQRQDIFAAKENWQDIPFI